MNKLLPSTSLGKCIYSHLLDPTQSNRFSEDNTDYTSYKNSTVLIKFCRDWRGDYRDFRINFSNTQRISSFESSFSIHFSWNEARIMKNLRLRFHWKIYFYIVLLTSNGRHSKAFDVFFTSEDSHEISQNRFETLFLMNSTAVTSCTQVLRGLQVAKIGEELLRTVHVINFRRKIW